MPNTRHNKYVSVTDWFATPPTSSQTGSVQQSVSRPSPLTGGGGGGNWGSTAVPPSSGGYSLEEIQYIVETYGSGFFLRKDRDDTANGVITFNDLVKSNDFAQGNLMGAGWSIYRDGNNSVVIETDRVIVRKDMTVSELIVNQETFLKGSTIYVKAGCTLTGVEDMGTYYRCYYDNKDGDEFSGFVENDLARCLRYDKSYALVVKYYWRKVVGVGDNYVDLSKIDGEYDGIGIPEEGDDIAQLGNTEDKTRQSAVVISPDSGGSVIIWAGINSFSLSEKNMVGMGVDPSSGKAYIYGYGDLYFGDRNQEQFINYSPEDGLHINGTLSIGTKFGDKTLLDVIDSATPDGYEEFVGNVTDELNDIKVNIDGVETSIIDLQKLLDGAIETWFYEGIPTLENAPAFNWTTDELKNAHLGDLYYNKTTGKAYRFQMDGTVYLWVEITDTDIQAAMQAANAAQDTADNKRRVFITTPYPPYDKGDLWSRGSEYPLMICVVPKESGNYVESDWDYADNLEKIKEELEQLVSDTTDDLNNAIGQATEAANKYTDEGIEGAKSSLQSSINALNEAKANANDVYTKAEADGIINQAEEDAILAAKQQADAAIALSEEIIKAYADGIVDDEEEARIKQAEENLQAAKDYADQKANEAFAQIAGYEYLKKALNEDTTVEGGLIQTSLLKLGYTNTQGQRVTMSGTNGVYNSNAIGGGVASWWGGDIYDLLDYYTWDGNKWNPKSNITIPTNIPSGLVRFDGTGYFAKGNLWWEEDGTLHADPSSLFLSFDVNAQEGTLAATILNIESTIAKFSDMWEIKEDSNGNEYLFAKRSVVTQGGLTQYSDTSGLNIDGIYAALPIDRDTIYWDNGVLKAQGGGGGITSITKDMVIEALDYTPYDATNPNGYITSDALNGYATQTWVNQQGFLTEHQDLSGYQPKITSSAKLAASLVSGLATVATSGSYNDLSNKPTIPTNTNQLTNGAGFITSSALDWSNIANKPSLLTISNSNLIPDSAQTITDLIAKTGGWTLVRGSWSYANNGHIWVDDFGGSISLAGATILTAGTNNWSGYTHLFITSPTSDLSNGLANEMLFYVNNGSDYSPSWTRVLTNRNYSSYALPLSGGTLSGALYFGGSSYIPYISIVGSGYLSVDSFGSEISIAGGNNSGIHINYRPTKGGFAPTEWYLRAGSGSSWANFYAGKIYASGREVWHGGNFNPSNYLPLSGGTITGNLFLKNTYFMWQETTNNYGGYFTGQSFNAHTNQGYTGQIFTWNIDGVLTFKSTPKVGSNTIWHSGNDGSGSGLDADLLDGLHNYGLHSYIFNYYANKILPSNTDLNNVTGGVWGTLDNTSYTNAPFQNFGLISMSLNSAYLGQLVLPYSYQSNIKYRSKYYDSGNIVWSDWRTLAFTTDNVASATKLQTARTIWGQSFNGTGDVDGKMKITYANASTQYYADNATVIIRTAVNGGVMLGLSSNTSGFSVIESSKEGVGVMPLCLNVGGGNVGIGTTSPAYKLHVEGSLGVGSTGGCDIFLRRSSYYSYIRAAHSMAFTVNNSDTFALTLQSNGQAVFDYNVGIGINSPSVPLHISKSSTTQGDVIRVESKAGWSGIVFTAASSYTWSINCSTAGNFNFWNSYLSSEAVYFTSAGDILAKGGITQYSDIRKKTKLKDVELTLSQVANAPLIEHYYNSDDKKTTHVGSIAQYWAEMNDWFCKLDSDGYYTMEIQNAALASAISIARELERYESKTDKKIRMLKKRINELEDEIEKLKSA